MNEPEKNLESKPLRNLRRLLFVGVCLVTVLAVLITEENWRGHRAWNDYRRALEAAGETLSLPELAPKPVPDDQNFALTPLLKPLFDFQEKPDGMRGEIDEDKLPRRDTNGFAHLEGIEVSRVMPSATNVWPFLGSPVKGTFTDLAAWQNFYRGNTNYPQPTTAGTAADDILVALGKFDPDLAELREAMVTRPYSRFPVAYDTDPPAAILLPHLSRMKGLTYLANLRATAELDLARPADALTDLKLGFRLSDTLQEEPILISHLVRIATLSFNLQTVREGLVRHAWTDAQLVELDHYLASLNLLAEWKHALRGERAYAVGNLDYQRRTGTLPPDVGSGGPWLLRKIFGTVLSGFYYQNALSISEMEGKYVLASVDENTRRIFPKLAEAAEAEVRMTHDHPFRQRYQIFAAMLLPAVNNLASRAAECQSHVDEARLAMAIERYWRATGHLPDNPGLLAPQFIDTIPADVADGQPLRYHPTAANAYVIYSIGWNLKDDGGVIGRKPEGKGIDPLSGDWVWFSSTNDFKLE